MKKPKPDELITISQAATLYGFNADYLRQLVSRGRLKAKRLGTQWITTPADVEQFIVSRKKTGMYRRDISRKGNPPKA